MAIGPIELNGVISRAQDFTIIKHHEDQKSQVDQNNFQMQFHKEVESKSTQVHHADDSENDEKRYDAKEKGNGEYDENGKKKREKKKNEEEEGKVLIKGQSHFDIKI